MPFSATRDLWLVMKAQNMASQAMRGFSRDIRMVGDSVRMANLQASRSALQNQMAVQRLTGASKQDLLVTQRRIQAVDQEIGQMRTSRAAMEEQRVSAQKLSSTLQGTAGMATALGTGLVAVGVFGAMGLKHLVDTAIEYQKASALTATQVDKFAISVQDIEKMGLKVATSVGVPFAEIQTALYNIFSSMEVDAAGAQNLLNVFAKAAVAGQTSIESASKATIGILNAFHLPLTDINHLMDIQFQLVKEGIGTYDEWTSRIGLVTPSAVRFGQSVDMMAAALAASTRMGIAAAQSGTAVARAMDAMSNPSAVIKLKALGIAATDAKGNFRPMIDILAEFRAELAKLPGGEVAKVAQILDVFKGAGGTIQARRFLQNMLLTPGNLETFKTIFETMSKESGSFEEAYSIMANTVATKSQLLSNKWEAVKIAAGEALIPVFLKVLNVMGSLFDKFNNLSPKTQRIITLILAWGVAGSIAMGVFLLVIGIIAGLAAAFTVAGSAILVVIGIIGGLVIAIAGIGAMFVVAYKKSQTFRDIMSDIGKFISHIWQDVFIPFVKDVKEKFERDLLPPLKRFGDWWVNEALPRIREFAKYVEEKVLPRIKELANWLKDRLGEAFKAIGWAIDNIVKPAFKWIEDWYDRHKDTIKQIVDFIIWFATQYGKYLMIILGILILVFGGPILVIIVAFIAALVAIAMTIVWLVDRVKLIVDWFKHFGDHMDWVASHFKDLSTTIGGFFAGLPSMIMNAVGDLGSTLFNSGKNLIDGLIRGALSKLPTLGGTASAIAGFFKSFFPFSPAKRGPLSGTGGMYYAGQSLVNQLTDGINSKLGIIAGGASLIATAAGSSVASTNTNTAGNTINQNITVNTQELNPRRQAVELGWLLAGSM